MSDERKPLWPWIGSLLFGLPVLYVASFGPACWVASRMAHPHPVIETVYLPLGWGAEKFGPPAWSPLSFYARLGMPPKTFLLLKGGGSTVLIGELPLPLSI